MSRTMGYSEKSSFCLRQNRRTYLAVESVHPSQGRRFVGRNHRRGVPAKREHEGSAAQSQTDIGPSNCADALAMGATGDVFSLARTLYARHLDGSAILQRRPSAAKARSTVPPSS